MQNNQTVIKELKEISNLIHWHYFDDSCKHENRLVCCEQIIKNILQVTERRKQ